MADELVTLATYGDLTEADIARAKLESAGIDCWLTDENMARYISVIAEGVKLQVRQQDAERAWEALSEPIPEEIRDPQTGEVYHQPKCPHCGSLDVSRRSSDGGQRLGGQNGGNSWYCEDCRTSWPAEDE